MGQSPGDIAIVGAGLGGLVLALSLKRQGITSTVYERQPKDFAQGTYIALAPNALRVLDDLGLYAKILPQGYAYESVTIANKVGTKFGTLYQGSRRLFGFPGLRVARTHVRHLLEMALHDAGVEVKYDFALSSLSETEEGVAMTFKDGSKVQAQLVIGADGINSTVREHINSDCTPIYNGVTVIYGSVNKNELCQEVLDSLPIPGMHAGIGGGFFVLPADEAGDEVAWIVSIALPDRPREEWLAFQKDRAEQLRIVREEFGQGNWAMPVKAVCKQTNVESVSAWPLFVLPELPKWSSQSNRIIVIGDAAHALSPVSTQGAGQAWGDGYTLALALSTNNSASTLQHTLQTWENHRREYVRKVSLYATDLEAKRKPSPNALLQKIKEYAMWVILWYFGEEGLAGWLYRYDGKESMKSLL